MSLSPVRAAIRKKVTDRVLNDAHLTARIDSETEVEAERMMERGFRVAELFDSVRNDVANGMNIITIIKNVRELTGWGLRDSKNFVDAFRNHGPLF